MAARKLASLNPTHGTVAGKFGTTRQLPSGKWLARYSQGGKQLSAPMTFETRQDALGWLRVQQVAQALALAAVKPGRTIAFGDYAERWMAQRDIAPSTRSQYRDHLDKRILPYFADCALTEISSTMVKEWHYGLPDRPTQRAQTYRVLHAIMAEAFYDELIPTQPVRIRRASSAKTQHVAVRTDQDQLQGLVDAMPERYKALTLVAAFCGLRFGEQIELRRKDVTITLDHGGNTDKDRGMISVTRAARVTDGVCHIGPPKSEAGVRKVGIPPHIVRIVADHIDRYAEAGPEGRLFPAVKGGHLASTVLYKAFYPAREKIGRPNLRWHDLRHIGASQAADAGASLAELMELIGHSSVSAALIYQQTARDSATRIAIRISEMNTAGLADAAATA